MQFEETDCVKIEVAPEPFVYLLLKNREVVYVGQTTVGASRFAGHADKDYDEIYVMYCDPAQLDYYEDLYMKKYLPKYNKVPNFAMNISLQRVKRAARERLGDDQIGIVAIRRAMRELGIQPYTVLDSMTYITPEDEFRLLEYMASGHRFS